MAIRSQLNEPVVVNGDMSANITSAVTLLPKISMVTYSYSWSGSSPSGTVIVQLSNDYALNADSSVQNAGSWNTIPFANSSGSVVTSFSISGNSGTGFLEVMTGAKAIRTVYTAASGSGSLQIVLNAKVT